ncbi:MAG TPA: hypothetical protein VF178_16105 [Gemmatimonadaceae bacterium]
MRRFVLAVLIGAPIVALDAQAPAAPDTAARRAAMQKLAFLAGDWVGPATANMPGGPLRMQQTEWVRYKLGGQILVVEGVGRLLAGETPGDTVFNAFAIVDWTPQHGYRMRSTTLEGRSGEFPLEVSDSGFVWATSAQGGRVRYTMRLTPAGEWHEVGEYLREGAPAIKVIEMRLKRR